MNPCTDLPEIQIVRHANAKNLRLRVDYDSIRLTVPRFCSQRQIDAFLQQSATWLAKTWQKQQQLQQAQSQELPNTIQLFDLDQPISIVYTEQKQTFIYRAEQAVVFISQQQAHRSLKAFVQLYAKQNLPPYLRQLSQHYQLPFAKCNIRQAKTRWGSCSRQHDIMLNAALVLYPEEVVRYVCIHELVHTQHFDHSAAFWSAVAAHDSAFQQHRKILKTTPLPFWWRVL